ncbi:MAG TPA: FtsX-like permease family protein [Ktedonobacteraceae bacterium]|nr:FtsX-like permease family protein [Ktedonobacteraceae bacterium]
MKASMYFNYTSRSLFRGGQRTVLAIFCVAVGVMAIVALQLVGQMINNSFTSNVRDANGGDISVSSFNQPFKQSDLSFFDNLKSQGTIAGYTAVINTNGSTGVAASATNSFSVIVVDTSTFPLVTPPTFSNPSNGSLSSLLTNDQVVIDQNVADQYNKKVGDSFAVHVSSQNSAAIILNVKVAGIVSDSGVFAQSNSFMVISQTDYKAALAASNVNAPLLYNAIYVSTNQNQALTDKAVKAIQNQFPNATTTTAADALKNNQTQVDFIKKFLDIAGLLALLIGGIGIVNTMQVLLSRRRIEIAMLKTTGYRRFDLYLLFGLEAGILGLVGGIVGAAAAIGVSFVVRNLVIQVFQISIPFLLDPVIIGGGILIGLFTALIFGLLPIVQAANIRPLNVIRELPGGNRVGSVFLTIGLLILLSVLFCVMAGVILNDTILAISAVYGTFIFLALLSLLFALVVLVISKLPVPERFSVGYLALILVGVAVSVLLLLILPTFGGLLLVVSLLGIVIVLLPRSWKVNMKMALRNIGRQRGRTTTTLLALFVGVFTIGLILVLGQDLRDNINAALAKSLTFNLVAITRGSDTSALQSKVSSIPGLSHSEQRSIVSVVPVSIDGVPLQNLVKRGEQGGSGDLGTAGTFYYLSGMEGYNVGNNQLPDTQQVFDIAQGRNLTASDVGQNNVLLSYFLIQLKPLKGHVHVGSVITFASPDGKIVKTVTVVGFYKSKSGFLSANYEPILATTSAVSTFTAPGQAQAIFYLKVDPGQIGKALNVIGSAAPTANVFNLASIGDFINQFINDILLVLITIASLSLLAGIIIIANAVALAMLERRRELGILKSVGYTSQSILGEVLIENGVIGATGALLAMLLVTLATSILSQFVFKSASFGVNGILVIGLIAGIALLAMLTATLVAWGAVRVRPLEVLRYE